MSVETEFVRAGRLGSGMHMAALADKIKQHSEYLISELTTKIAAVSRTPEAFVEIEASIGRWLRGCEDELNNHIGTARSLRLQERGLAKSLGEKNFQDVVEAVGRRVEIEKFDFSAATSKDPPPAAVPPDRAKKGGRLPAEFWDDMWAATAAALFDGSLMPKTQADVERAMSTWIEDNGFEAATSTVRGRARRLWDRIRPTSE